jgi:hypothetical protein
LNQRKVCLIIAGRKACMMTKKKIDPAIAKIRGMRSMAVRIAEAFKIDKSDLYQWKHVAAERVLEVSELIGMPPEQIRPDVSKR